MSQPDVSARTIRDPYVRRTLETRARRSHRSRRSASGLLIRFQRALPRSESSLLALTVLVAALMATAWQSGGYFPVSYCRTGAVVALGGVCLLILRPPLRGISIPAQLALSALIALTAWTWIASNWSPAPSAGLLEAQRDLTYLVVFAVAAIACGSGRSSSAATLVVLCAMTAVVGSGLASRVLPTGPGDPNDYRLSYPLDYWNAFGALASMAIVLGSGIAADRRVRAAVRSMAAGAALLCSVAMYLSLSRGAWLALGVGLVVLVLAAPRKLPLLGTLLIVAGGFVVALLALHSLPALVDNPDLGRGQIAAAHRFSPILGALLGAVCVAQFALAKTESWIRRRLARRWRRSPLSRLNGRTMAVGVGVLAVCAVIGAAPQLERALSRAWDSSGQQTANLSGTSRLTTLQTSRHDAYRVGIQEWKSAPLVGVGAGGYDVGWYEHRHVNEDIVNAHSLYVETMAELGLVGLALVLAFLVTIVIAGARTRLRPVGLSRTRAAAVLAAVSVWIIHAGVDWDWQVTSLTGFALVLMAMLLPAGADRRGAAPVGPVAAATQGQRHDHATTDASATVPPLWRRSRPTVVRLGGAAVVLLAIAIYLWGSSVQASRVDSANRLGAIGRYGESLATARSVSQAPFTTQAKATIAYDLQEIGDLRAANAAYAAAVAADPSNWNLRENWAGALVGAHHRQAARRQLARAIRLNPLLRGELPPALSQLR